MMNRTTPLSIVLILACLLAACAEAEAGIPITGQGSDLQLEVESPDGENALQQGDQPITYNYVITNTGPQSLRGPVMVNDPPRQVSCPQLSTVGDLDDELDFNESITCTAFYTPSTAERSAGSITNRAQANVGGKVSSQSTFTLGRSAASPTREGEGIPGTPAASPTPTPFRTITPGTTADATETPSAFPTVTQDAAAEPAETPFVILTATQGTSLDSTGTPSVVPTATVVSSAGGTPGATASVDSINVVDLPAGVETIALAGIVPAGGTVRYSIDAATGQQLSLTFLVTTNQLSVGVTGPDGVPVKTAEAAMPWSVTVSSAGDYLIEVRNADGAAGQPYVLELRRTPAN